MLKFNKFYPSNKCIKIFYINVKKIENLNYIT